MALSGELDKSLRGEDLDTTESCISFLDNEFRNLRNERDEAVKRTRSLEDCLSQKVQELLWKSIDLVEASEKAELSSMLAKDKETVREELSAKLRCTEDKLAAAQKLAEEKTALLDEKMAEISDGKERDKHDISTLQTAIESIKAEKEEALKKCADLEEKLSRNVESILYKNLELVEAIEELEKLNSQPEKEEVTSVFSSHVKKLDDATVKLQVQSQLALANEAIIKEKDENIRQLKEKLLLLDAKNDSVLHERDVVVKNYQDLLGKMSEKEEALLWKSIALIESHESIETLKAKADRLENEAFCYAQKLDSQLMKLSETEECAMRNANLLSSQLMITKELEAEMRILNNKLVAKNSFIESEKARHELEINELKEKFQMGQSISSSDERIKALEADLSEKENELLKAQNEATEARKLLIEQSAVNGQLVGKIASLEITNSDILEKLAQTESDVVEKSIELISYSVLLEEKESNIEELLKKLAKKDEAHAKEESELRESELLELKLADKDNTISELTSSLHQTEDAVKAKADEIIGLQAKLDATKEDYSLQVQDFQEKLKAAHETNARISAQLESGNAEIESLRRDKADTAIHLSESSSKSDSLQRDLEESSKNCEALRNELLKIEITLEKQREECAEKDAEILKLNSSLANKDEGIQRLSGKLADYEKELSERASKDESFAQLMTEKNSEIDRLCEQIENSSQTWSAMQQRIAALEEKVTASNETLLLSERKINDLESNVGSSQAALSAAEQKIIELNESLEAQILDKMQVEEMLDEAKEKADQLNGQLDEFKASLAKANEIHDDLRREIVSNQGIVGELKQQIDELNQQKEKMQDTLDTKEGEFVQSIDELQNDLNKKLKDLAETKALADQLTVKIMSLESESAANASTLQEEIKNLDEKLKIKADEMNELNGSLSKAKEINEQQRREIGSLETEMALLKSDNEKLSEEFSELKDKSDSKEEELAQSVGELKRQLEQKTNDHESLNASLAQLTLKLEAVESESTKLANELQETIKAQKTTIEANNVEVEDLKASLTEAYAICEERLGAISAKESERQKLKEEFLVLNSEKLQQVETFGAKEDEYVKSIAMLLKDVEMMTSEQKETQAKVDKLTAELEAVEVESVKCAENLRETIKANEDQIAKLTSETIKLTADRDSRVSKIKLLLGNQKKMESQLERSSVQYEDLAKEKAELEKRVADRDTLVEEIGVCHKRIEELETELSQDVSGGNFPWEVDPELKDMAPMELRYVLAGELSTRETAKLNEMCVAELEKELRVKTSSETAHVWEISSLKKELQKCQFKLGHLESQRSAVRAAILSEAEETKPTSAKKRRSTELTGTPRVTRSRSSKSSVSDNAENDEVASKKARRESVAMFSSKLDNTVLRSKQKKYQIAKSMPENPFAKKANTLISGLQTEKRPLETITNRTLAKND